MERGKKERERGREGRIEKGRVKGRDKEKRQSKNDQVHLVYGRDVTLKQLEL